MMELDRRYGPWSGRVWGLVANFFANALALYGVAGYIRDGSRWGALVLGLVVTLVLVLILARPSR